MKMGKRRAVLVQVKHDEEEEKEKKQKRPKKLPVFLDEQERLALIDQPNPRYFTGHRNKVMMQFILDAGLRLSEATSFKWSHIDMMTGRVLVKQGKGKKDRYIWIGESILEQLTGWRQRQAEKSGKMDYVFTTAHGTPLKNRYVQTMVKRYAVKAKIEKNISPHKLRHTFATDFYRNTQDILKTMKALGHEDVSTTMIYTHVVDDDLEEAMKGFRKK